jgi:hypothetical protein
MQFVATLAGNQRLLTKGNIKAQLSVYKSTQGWSKAKARTQTYFFSGSSFFSG